MSPDFRLSKIQDFRTVCYDYLPASEPPAEPPRGSMFAAGWSKQEDGSYLRLNPITNGIIWGTVAVDLGEITTKNAPEFYSRLEALRRSGTPMLQNEDGTERPITLEEVEAHIGLTTNVRSTTASAFRVKLGRALHEEAQRIAERLIEKRKAAAKVA